MKSGGGYVVWSFAFAYSKRKRSSEVEEMTANVVLIRILKKNIAANF